MTPLSSPGSGREPSSARIRHVDGELRLLTTFVRSSRRKAKSATEIRRWTESQFASPLASDRRSPAATPRSVTSAACLGSSSALFCATVTTRTYVAEEEAAGRLGACRPPWWLKEIDGGSISQPRTSMVDLDALPTPDIHGLDAELAPNPRDVWCRNFGLTTI